MPHSPNKQPYISPLSKPSLWRPGKISRLILIAWLSVFLFSFLSSCGSHSAGDSAEASHDPHSIVEPLKWRMVTSWPKDFPVVGTGANDLASNITAMSGGRIEVTVYGAGELGGGLDVLDMVTRGVAEMGHSASFYWRGRIPALQFFGAMPFGMTAQEVNAWFYHDDGLKLWHEVYAPLGIIGFPAGNTGVQMGGWFNKVIDSHADLEGLRMRIPGLGGEVFAEMGGFPVVLPAGEIFTALTTGVLDAAEWSGPANDLPQGFHQSADYYYYPGWQEPTTTVECLIHLETFNALSADLQAIVRIAAQAANTSMTAEYTARNISGLKTITDTTDVTILPFPDDVLSTAWVASRKVLSSLSEDDAVFTEVRADYEDFLQKTAPWSVLSEQSYLQARANVIKPLKP